MLTEIRGSVGGVTYRTQAGKLVISNKSSGRLGLRKSGGTMTTTTKGDLISWAKLTADAKAEWTVAAAKAGMSVRKAWLSACRWARATADWTTWEAGSGVASGGNWYDIAAQAMLHQVVIIQPNVQYPVAYTYDCVHWVSGSGLGWRQWVSCCWDYGHWEYVVLESGGAAVFGHSADGVVWTEGRIPEGNTWNHVASSMDERMTMAIASSGTHQCMTRSMMGDWVLQTGFPAGSWSGVTWASGIGLWIVVGLGGTHRCAVSADGVTWSTATDMPAVALQDVAWSPVLGMGMAISATGPMQYWTTTNGTHWTQHLAPIYGNWTRIRWCDGLNAFVLTSSASTQPVAISCDGISWAQYSIPSLAGAHGAAWDAWSGQLVVASYGSGSRPVVAPVTLCPQTVRGGPRLVGYEQPIYSVVDSGVTLNLTPVNTSETLWNYTTSSGRSAVQITVPAVEWVDMYGLPGTWAVDAYQTLLEVDFGVPLLDGQIHYKGKWRSAGRCILRPGPWTTQPLVYPWEQPIGPGSRLPVRYRLYARGYRSSRAIKTTVTIG